MTKGVSKKLQRNDLLRKKRAQATTGLATGAKKPPKAIPIPSAAPRPPASLPASLGERPDK